jgi:hypothetical protein
VRKLEASVEVDHEYDVMLMSFVMAKLNNFHLVKQVRAVAFMMPVIAYGRDIKQSDMQSRNVNGIDDYIKAPFADEEISTKMVRWYARRLSSLSFSIHPPAGCARPVSFRRHRTPPRHPSDEFHPTETRRRPLSNDVPPSKGICALSSAASAPPPPAADVVARDADGFWLAVVLRWW